eukprot:CAMPEP_0176488474 /NCGR_PEP_ID=MMETSP0200_2-20121128/6729_1 /TAXON_ID=947934 /ORGANISM="Chaetoceros sp., Strain GSL56" /LENGTH=330 /DNA_ID=CAMNT_0017885461 /DNA_START=43 /DNA_END=1035 /DNA_ORIENTATION=-
MMKSILSLTIAIALCAIHAAVATTVAIKELGQGGVLHRTSSSSSPTTSAGGVMSFWKSTHDADENGVTREYRTVQYPGMSVVTDLFSRPKGGIILGLTGPEVDLDSMPTVALLLQQEEAVTGHFYLAGNQGRKLMRHMNAPHLSSGEFIPLVKVKGKEVIVKEGNRLESLSVHIQDKKEAAAVDESIRLMIESVQEEAKKSGSTILLHVVVDQEEEDVARGRRRLVAVDDGTHRQLAENQGNNQNNNNQNNKQGQQQNQQGSYQIPGYYDDNNNFVTPFRTIFQIQYYNVVQWTALGLFTILFAANYMTMNMPLMPDTLLFGESAKMVAE